MKATVKARSSLRFMDDILELQKIEEGLGSLHHHSVVDRDEAKEFVASRPLYLGIRNDQGQEYERRPSGGGSPVSRP